MARTWVHEHQQVQCVSLVRILTHLLKTGDGSLSSVSSVSCRWVTTAKAAQQPGEEHVAASPGSAALPTYPPIPTPAHESTTSHPQTPTYL
jgi:hypothetical protein